jgi:flavin-binding protein dodecin
MAMASVARVTEISAESEVGFEDAIKVGISRANETLRGVKSAWVKEQSVQVQDGAVTSYRVDMLVTFLLEG